MRRARTALLARLVLAPVVGAGLAVPGEAREPKTLKAIESTGSVTVCADPDNLPFSSAGDGWPGYDVEVMRAVAAGLGARADFRWVSTRSARAAIRHLLDGECDLFPGLPVSPGFAGEFPQLAFSRSYYTMGHAIVTRSGERVGSLAGLGAVTTAVEALSPGDLVLLSRGYRRRSYRTQEAAFRAVQAAEAPAALLWAPVAGWLAKRSGDPDLVLVAVSDPDLAVSFGVGFLRADPALGPALDRVIARLEARGAIGDVLRRYGVPLADRRPSLRRPVVPVAWRPGGAPRPRLAQAEPRARPPAPADAPDPVEGRRIFEANCEGCHGTDGRGGGGVPRLQAYPAGAEPRFVRAVLEGRNSLGMPPWGGLLTEAQVRSILAYVRALVPSVQVAAGASPEERARQVFGQICTTCHGARGEGTRLAPSLQAFRGTDREFVETVLGGRPGTAMAPFASLLSAEAAGKIRDYVRELARLN